MNKKQKLIWIFLGALLVTLTGCKTLQENTASKTFTQPEGVTLMTETEIRDTLVGNSYEGESSRKPGNTYKEYIDADGTTSGLWNDKDRYKGEWAISGNIICTKYKNSNGCNTLSKSGNTIYWYQLDGTTMGGKSKMMDGDPYNLSK